MVIPVVTPVIERVPPLMLSVAIFRLVDAAYGAVPPLIDTVAVLPAMTLTLLWLTTTGVFTVTLIETFVLFVSVTVIVAVPAATPVMLIVPPLRLTVAVFVFEDDTVYAPLPPLTAAVADLPVTTLRLAWSTANGAVTVTPMEATPLFLSSIVIETTPVATPVTVTVLPVRLTVAVFVFPEVTV